MHAARRRAADNRGEDRRQAAPQRRRAPAPCAGLDEVEKVLSRWCEALADVGRDSGRCKAGGHAVPGIVEAVRGSDMSSPPGTGGPVEPRNVFQSTQREAMSHLDRLLRRRPGLR